jgi:hypothetical protein
MIFYPNPASGMINLIAYNVPVVLTHGNGTYHSVLQQWQKKGIAIDFDIISSGTGNYDSL